MLTEKDAIIREHYKGVAAKHGASSQSTMEDEVVRAKEIEQIVSFLDWAATGGGHDVLDLGCGNGYALSVLAESRPANRYKGLDASDELLEIANGRQLPNCCFAKSDARRIELGDASVDVVYTERCLINILDWEGQLEALREIHRILRPGGHFLMIECFTDGLDNNNKAREECGLEKLKEAYHNRYFEKEQFLGSIGELFSIVQPPEGSPTLQMNFLSSHYFVARVLHPLVTKGTAVKNTEFVKFFSMLPPFGNYSPIQSFILQKR
jgi:ubiquinone/menaquinone biosynthesis C-methylase UbiE